MPNAVDEFRNLMESRLALVRGIRHRHWILLWTVVETGKIVDQSRNCVARSRVALDRSARTPSYRLGSPVE